MIDFREIYTLLNHMSHKKRQVKHLSEAKQEGYRTLYRKPVTITSLTNTFMHINEIVQVLSPEGLVYAYLTQN